ncbi:LemA protein [Elusimicrobium posterum]|uniref:LemA family protein n=1 Tax=Elusimicrobium posterum TaxID=3116653 RepID=UPI003C76DC8D
MNSLMIAFIILICTLGIAVYGYFRVSSFNRLMESAWNNIDVLLRYRMDVVKSIAGVAAAYVNDNEALAAALKEIQKNEIAAYNIAQRCQEEEAFTKALSKFFAVAGNTTDLKSNENFLMYKKSLYKAEKKIAASADYYNTNAKMFNSIISTIPVNLVAKMFDFDAKPAFNFNNTEMVK